MYYSKKGTLARHRNRNVNIHINRHYTVKPAELRVPKNSALLHTDLLVMFVKSYLVKYMYGVHVHVQHEESVKHPPPHKKKMMLTCSVHIALPLDLIYQ